MKVIMLVISSSANRGDHKTYGWRDSCYSVSKIGLSALTRIQQRKFEEDPRQNIFVNHVHPGYVDTDMTSHKGPLKIEEGNIFFSLPNNNQINCVFFLGAVAPSWLALIPKDAEGPKGSYVWHDKQIVDWVHGPMPSAY